MNKQRRKVLEEIIEEMDVLLTKLEDVKTEEEEAYDNMPESFQEGERGERMQEAIDSMDSAYSGLEEARDSPQEVLDA